MASISVNEWLDMMPSTVTINSCTGIDGSGKRAYSSTGVNYPARIEMKNHIVISHDGREVMARGSIFMGTTTAPDIKDQITLPDGFSPSQPPIIAINLQDDENGRHHVTLEIG